MYGADSADLIKIFAILAVLALINVSANVLLRRKLGIQKPKTLRPYHVNGLHKKFERLLLGLGMLLVVFGYFFTINQLPEPPLLIAQPFFLLMLTLYSFEILRAIMERKYARNPNAYKFTIIQIAYISVVLIAILMTGFFGIY